MKNMKKRFSIFICLCVLLSLSWNAPVSYAKKENTAGGIVTKTMNGNIGPVTGPGKSIVIQGETEQIKKGMEYSFYSNNTSIVDVDKKTGAIVGKKAGTADISVKKTYKGKIRTIGTCKVTIHESAVSGEKKVAVGTFTINVKNENPNAVYTYESEKPAIVSVGSSKTTLTALKEGSTIITVNETYQNRSRKVGTATIIVAGATMHGNIPAIVLAKGQSKSIFPEDYLEYVNTKATYHLTEENKGIIQTGKEKNGKIVIEAVKAGTERIIFTEKRGKKTHKIGLLTVTVKDSIPCKDIYFDENFTSISADTMGEEPYTITIHMTEGESIDLPELTHLNPSNTTDRLMYLTEDEDIIAVDEKTGTMTALKAGTGEFLLKSGKITQAGMVNVDSKDVDSPIQKMAAETSESIEDLIALPIQKGQLVKAYNARVNVYNQIEALEKAFNNDDIPDGMSMGVLLPNEQDFDDYTKRLMTAIQKETSLFQNKKGNKDAYQVTPKITKIDHIKADSISITWEKESNTADILYALYAYSPHTLYQSESALTLPMDIYLADRGHFYTNATMTLANGKKIGTVKLTESLVKENYKMSCKQSLILADKTAEKEFSYR